VKTSRPKKDRVMTDGSQMEATDAFRNTLVYTTRILRRSIGMVLGKQALESRSRMYGNRANERSNKVGQSRNFVGWVAMCRLNGSSWES
jgi:hypothetical protein